MWALPSRPPWAAPALLRRKFDASAENFSRANLLRPLGSKWDPIPAAGGNGPKAHIGEVQSSLWDEANLKACREAGITLL